MNDLEWYALIFCLSAIAAMVLLSWMFGRDDCNGNCEQGRRCRCQKENQK